MSSSCFDSGSNSTSSSGSTEAPESLVVIGTLLVIGASFVSTTGLNMQKLAHTRNEQLPPSLRKNYATLWTWQLGMLMMVAGSLMDLAALPFVPQSRVAVLGSTSLVANVLITPVFLGEKITRFDVIGCLITMIGCSMATYFGAAVEKDLTPDCMAQHFLAPMFLMYFAVVLIFLSVLYYYIKGHQVHKAFLKARNLLAEADDDVEQPIQSSAAADNAAINSPQFATDDSLKRLGSPTANEITEEELQEALAPYVYVSRTANPKFYPVIYVAFAGTAGAQSIMFAKATLEMLVTAIKGQSSPGWLIITLPPFGLCLWAQVNFLNQALKLYDAMFVIPVYQIFWIVMGIFSGLLFYQEYRAFTPVRTAGFIVGMMINLLGIYVMSRRKHFAKEGELEMTPQLKPASHLAGQSLLNDSKLSDGAQPSNIPSPTSGDYFDALQPGVNAMHNTEGKGVKKVRRASFE